MGKRKFETDEERYYLSWNSGSRNHSQLRNHVNYWRRRTVIFHYSNGTNTCCVPGCNATVDELTLEHEDFNGIELSANLGYKGDSIGRGGRLIDILLTRRFPDVNITVKCMYHNMQNKHPELNKRISENHRGKKPRDHINSNYYKLCPNCGQTKNQIEFHLDAKTIDNLHHSCKTCTSILNVKNKRIILKKAYKLYGYEGPLEGMSWEHSNNDGAMHRKYLADKYNLTGHIGSNLAALLLREHAAGVPNHPGLIVVPLNEQLTRRRQYLKKQRERKLDNNSPLSYTTEN